MTDPGRPQADPVPAARRHAPAPDDDRKPDSPTDLTKPTWRFALRNTVRQLEATVASDGTIERATPRTIWIGIRFGG